MKISKGYLILFIRGKRYVEEINEISIERPPLVEGIGDSLVKRKPTISEYSGIAKTISLFQLIGKHRKIGKKEWNKFLDNLKLK